MEEPPASDLANVQVTACLRLHMHSLVMPLQRLQVRGYHASSDVLLTYWS